MKKMNQELMGKLRELAECATRIDELWGKNCEELDCAYPFQQDFSEIVRDTKYWAKKVRQNDLLCVEEQLPTFEIAMNDGNCHVGIIQKNVEDYIVVDVQAPKDLILYKKDIKSYLLVDYYEYN